MYFSAMQDMKRGRKKRKTEEVEVGEGKGVWSKERREKKRRVRKKVK